MRVKFVVAAALIAAAVVLASIGISDYPAQAGCLTTAKGQNLVRNGDFSNGTSGWQLFPPDPQVSTIPNCQGDAAYLVAGSGINAVVGRNGPYFSSNNCSAQVKPGLTFSLWSKVSKNAILTASLTFIGSYPNGTGVAHKWFMTYLLSWRGPAPANGSSGLSEYRSILVNSSRSSWKEQSFDIYSDFKNAFGDPASFCVNRVSAGDGGGNSFITNIALVEESI